MNNINLVGRLTKDPDLKVTASNLSVCNFTLAVNRAFKNQEGKIEADFINCVAFRSDADNIAKYVSKGQQLAVNGRLEIKSYEGNDGVKRISSNVIINSFTFIAQSQPQAPSGENSPTQNSMAESLRPIHDDSVPFW